ncbi:hypothetical protein GGF31_003725 [Allomyces arbusculus]|nr:hypothetical protein GGF31_003725 [Allomyces arbusculus]
MSWLQKLKGKSTKSKDNLVDTPAGASPKVGPVDATAPKAADDGTSPASSTGTSPANSPTGKAATAGIEAGIATIKLTAIHPTFTESASTSGSGAAPSKSVSGTLHVRILEGKEIMLPGIAPAAGNPSYRNPYIVLGYDKNEVVVNSSGGTAANPVWKHRATFDLTDDKEPLSVTLLLRYGAAHAAAAVAASSDAGAAASPGTHPNDVVLGTASIDAATFPSSADVVLDKWLPLFLPSSSVSSAQLHVQMAFRPDSKSVRPVTIDDFELLKVIGKGSFGKVMQVRKKDTGRIYAMKILKKSHIVSREEVGHTISERNVLKNLRHPFIVSLKFAFQNAQKLYLVLPFINGGELFKHLSVEGRFSEARSRFYAAELTSALECLHSHSITYRDLKPENILLDYAGHIALCDFGLCKLNMGDGVRTNTFCGTPEYLACEVLLGNGYTKSVDWWTLGILLYEMLTGLPPYYDENVNEMYRKILYAPLTFPADVPPLAQDLLTKLLDRDPDKRLGAKGAAEIKAHGFWAPIDWDALYRRAITPPFKPTVENAFDTSNFDQEFTNEVPCDSVVNESVLSQTVQGQFAGFTYVPTSELAGGAADGVSGSVFGTSVLQSK